MGSFATTDRCTNHSSRVERSNLLHDVTCRFRSKSSRLQLPNSEQWQNIVPHSSGIDHRHQVLMLLDSRTRLIPHQPDSSNTSLNHSHAARSFLLKLIWKQSSETHFFQVGEHAYHIRNSWLLRMPCNVRYASCVGSAISILVGCFPLPKEEFYPLLEFHLIVEWKSFISFPLAELDDSLRLRQIGESFGS